MQFLRRNTLSLLIGAGVTLFVVAVVVGIADLARDDDADHGHRISVGAAQFDLDELHETLEGLDFENFDLAELLDSPAIAVLVEALRSALGGELGGRNSFELFGGIGDRQPVLGVTIDAASDGLVVEAVQPGSAASSAGIERGDEILSVDGRDVGTIEELREVVAGVMTGDRFQVALLRDGRRIRVDVEPRAFVAQGIGPALRDLGERFRQGLQRQQTPDRDGRAPEQTPRPREVQPARPGAPQLGVAAIDAPNGVRVIEVQPLSGAAQAGLLPGDVLAAVEGTPVSSVAQLRAVLGRFAAGDFVRVTVLRDGGRLQLSILLSPPAAVFVVDPGVLPGLGSGFDSRIQRGFEQPQQALLGGLLTPEAAASTATEAILEQLADLVAERLAARTTIEPAATATPAPQASEPAPPELTAFFGRVAAIDEGSVRLDGTSGSVAFVLTDETLRLGFKDAAIGDLVTVVVSDGVVQLLIVVG